MDGITMNILNMIGSEPLAQITLFSGEGEKEVPVTVTERNACLFSVANNEYGISMDVVFRSGNGWTAVSVLRKTIREANYKIKDIALLPQLFVR